MVTVYVETTVVGTIAGRVHPDLTIAARQTITRRWWATATSRYRLLISQLVLDECAGGDPMAAKERLEEINALPLVDITEQVRDLADDLMASGAIPASEPRDALHIAVAAVHGIEYLVTWNFKHIANATMRGRIESACRDAGFEPPIICTPEELAGDDADTTLTN
jgi:predicted nucleic acid-binding protein